MNISVQQLDDMRKSGEAHTLLDIREAEELMAASISGALHIPMNTIPDNLDKLPTDQPLVVMCHVGGRSAQVQMWLHGNGFENAVNLEGGIHAWSLSIDSSVPQY
ncbi:MAG: sulfurtransferase [Rhodospirillaceae bacterium]|nr:sulfurtransferase [Rhodospirillaceae bacterium]|tara:strand:+ start:436 stop:750 length:315 start_codon:yes stop_codon:yes gene_type:complete